MTIKVDERSMNVDATGSDAMTVPRLQSRTWDPNTFQMSPGTRHDWQIATTTTEFLWSSTSSWSWRALACVQTYLWAVTGTGRGSQPPDVLSDKQPGNEERLTRVTLAAESLLATLKEESCRLIQSLIPCTATFALWLRNTSGHLSIGWCHSAV